MPKRPGRPRKPLIEKLLAGTVRRDRLTPAERRQLGGSMAEKPPSHVYRIWIAREDRTGSDYVVVTKAEYFRFLNGDPNWRDG